MQQLLAAPFNGSKVTDEVQNCMLAALEKYNLLCDISKLLLDKYNKTKY
jgi:hypothetical protein